MQMKVWVKYTVSLHSLCLEVREITCTRFFETYDKMQFSFVSECFVYSEQLYISNTTSEK